MSSPLPSNMAMTTVRGRYGAWTTVLGESEPHFSPYAGMQITFTPAYPFVTNINATPSPLVIATAPRQFVTDSEGYVSDPSDGGNRNCMIVSSDDPDISPRDWKYLVTFTGPGATHFRPFRTPAPSSATIDMAIITPQRISTGTTPTTAEIAAANAAASAAAAQAAVASLNKGQAGGVAPLDNDGDVNDAFGVKILAGGGGAVTNPHTILANIDDMSPLARLLSTDTTQSAMRSRIGAGTGNGTSNLAIGTTAGTAADAAAVASALGLKSDNDSVMHLAGDETVDGTKSFLDPLVIPTGTASDHAVNLGQLTAVSTGLTNYSSVVALTGYPATFPPTLPIPQSGVTDLGASLSVLDARIDTLEAGNGTLPQEMVWNGNTVTTNATAYGTYDTTRAIHFFRGARNPLEAGYTLQVDDRWFEPEVIAPSLPELKIDDTLLTYTGTGWQVGNDVSTYNTSDHYTVVTNDKASFTWTCEANGTVAVIAKKAPHHGIMTIKIDTVTVGTADLYAAANTYNSTVFLSAFLTAGSHTIEIICSGTKNALSSGFTAEIDALLLTGAATGTGGTVVTPPAPGTQPTGFFTRVGNEVRLNGVKWRGTGVNLPWSMGCGSGSGLTPTLGQHTTMFAAAKPNSIYRIWIFGGSNLATFDAILNAARPYGHRFIPVLADRMGGCGEPYCGPNPNAFYSGGWISGGWRDNWLTPVVNRYKTEPLIGWWEWVNEIHVQSSVRTFFDQVGAYVRNTLGDQHMIGTGTMSQYAATGSAGAAAMVNLNSSPYIDIASQHEYDQSQAPSNWTDEDAASAAAAGKPWYVGESGINPSNYAAGTARANQIKAKIDALRTSWPTCAAYLYWSGAAPGFTQADRMEISINGSSEINIINTTAF